MIMILKEAKRDEGMDPMRLAVSEEVDVWAERLEIETASSYEEMRLWSLGPLQSPAKMVGHIPQPSQGRSEK